MEPHDVTRPAHNSIRTICEVHREIYRGVILGKPKGELVRLLQESYKMAKKMDAKLREYRDGRAK